MLKRQLSVHLEKWLFSGKAIIVVGARQAGKTTLINLYLNSLTGKHKIKTLLGDDPSDRELVENKSLNELDNLFSETDIIFFDEAHKFKNIGNTIKMMVDRYKTKKQIIVTASSSFNLLDHTAEPLTGRRVTFTLYPFSISEMFTDLDLIEIKKSLPDLLIYGSYPEIFLTKNVEKKQTLLKELTTSYLFKDVLEFQLIKNADKIRDLVRALALQIGKEVSYLELHATLHLDPSTIEKYVDLLEKNQVIFRLSPYARNARRAISKLRKIYFFDLGVRNAMISNFNPLNLRGDVGELWENFLIIERMKYKSQVGIQTNDYFFRTYDGGEVDFVEESDGKLRGFEFKFGKPVDKIFAPPSWRELPGSTFLGINQENFKKFILEYRGE